MTIWWQPPALEPDNSKRLQIFQRAEDLLLNQGTPICPLYYYVGIQIYDGQKFGGIEPNLLDEHPFREMYRKPQKKILTEVPVQFCVRIRIRALPDPP